jgi:hypothetical protein
VNVQGVREVPDERNVCILKDRCDKRREESVVRRFIICNVNNNNNYYYYYHFNKINERLAGHVASVRTIVIRNPGRKNHFEDLGVYAG